MDHKCSKTAGQIVTGIGSGVDTGGGHSPPLNLEFFVPIFRIAILNSMLNWERNPSAKQEKYLS